MALRLRCGDGRDGSLEREPNRSSSLTLRRDLAGSGPLYRPRSTACRNLPLLSAVLIVSSSPAILGTGRGLVGASRALGSIFERRRALPPPRRVGHGLRHLYARPEWRDFELEPW